MAYDNPTTAFVQSYANNVQMTAQQMVSRLYDKVRVETPTGERHYFELYGKNGEMDPVTTRFESINLTDTAFARRAVDPKDYDFAQAVDNFDKLKTLIDPMSSIVQAQGAQMGRMIDKIIIDGAYADALAGKTGSTVVPFPAGQQIAVNSWAYGTGSGNSNLTVSKILEAAAKMNAAEVPEGNRYMVIDAVNNAKLLAQAETTSKDFVSSFNLERGKIMEFAGFQFIHSELLPLDGSGYRRILAFHSTGIGAAVPLAPKAAIDRLVNVRSQPWQAYLMLSMAATRLEEEKVVEIKCLAT